MSGCCGDGFLPTIDTNTTYEGESVDQGDGSTLHTITDSNGDVVMEWTTCNDCEHTSMESVTNTVNPDGTVTVTVTLTDGSTGSTTLPAPPADNHLTGQTHAQEVQPDGSILVTVTTTMSESSDIVSTFTIPPPTVDTDTWIDPSGIAIDFAAGTLTFSYTDENGDPQTVTDTFTPIVDTNTTNVGLAFNAATRQLVVTDSDGNTLSVTIPGAEHTITDHHGTQITAGDGDDVPLHRSLVIGAGHVPAGEIGNSSSDSDDAAISGVTTHHQNAAIASKDVEVGIERNVVAASEGSSAVGGNSSAALATLNATSSGSRAANIASDRTVASALASANLASADSEATSTRTINIATSSSKATADHAGNYSTFGTLAEGAGSANIASREATSASGQNAFNLGAANGSKSTGNASGNISTTKGDALADRATNIASKDVVADGPSTFNLSAQQAVATGERAGNISDTGSKALGEQSVNYGSDTAKADGRQSFNFHTNAASESSGILSGNIASGDAQVSSNSSVNIAGQGQRITASGGNNATLATTRAEISGTALTSAAIGGDDGKVTDLESVSLSGGHAVSGGIETLAHGTPTATGAANPAVSIGFRGATPVPPATVATLADVIQALKDMGLVQ